MVKQPILILADSLRDGTCRSCGATITWATAFASNRAMPFDRPVVLVPQLAWDKVEPQIASIDPAQTISHFATCPQAAQWRQRR
jgi:hypothetical protein